MPDASLANGYLLPVCIYVLSHVSQHIRPILLCGSQKSLQFNKSIQQIEHVICLFVRVAIVPDVWINAVLIQLQRIVSIFNILFVNAFYQIVDVIELLRLQVWDRIAHGGFQGYELCLVQRVKVFSFFKRAAISYDLLRIKDLRDQGIVFV